MGIRMGSKRPQGRTKTAKQQQDPEELQSLTLSEKEEQRRGREEQQPAGRCEGGCRPGGPNANWCGGCGALLEAESPAAAAPTEQKEETSPPGGEGEGNA